MDNKRKGINIQTWTRKGLSFLMALLLCVTTVFSVPTVSFAAEGEETAQTATEEQTSPSEGTSVVFKRNSEDSENPESATENEVEANDAEIESAENALKNSVSALQKTQPAGLADGLYKVPLKLKHAYDGERLSMGNGAVIQTATMDVKNGKATLYMQMRGLHFMGMYGHLYKLFQWKSDENGADPYSFQGKKEPVQVIRTGKDSNLMGELMEFPEILKLTDCDVTKPYVPVCVWVDAMDAIQSGGASSYDKIRQGAGEQNAKLTPDWSKAEKLAAGTDLEAALLQVGIKQYVQAASRDAAKYSAKSYAPYEKVLDTLEGLASGELQDADTLFNALQDFKAARHNLVDAKKADLKDLLDQAKELKEKDYTKESWDALQKAVKDASKTFNKSMANETEIKNAENALKDAIAALQKKEDPQKAQALKALQEQLAKIRALKKSDYTPESWKPLAMQKKAAEALLKKQDATTEELLLQVKALKAALADLKKATPKPNPNPTPNPGGSKPQPTEVYYEVPVQLMHAYEKNKHSMGNAALVHTAKVFVTKNGLSYELDFTGMSFMGMYGHLWNLFYRNEPCGAEAWTPAVVLEQKSDRDLENKMRKFPSKFRLNCTGEAQKNLPNLKTKSRIHVKVWVDAMDALNNGAKTYDKIVKGAGAQKAYLEFDWSRAVKHGSAQPNPNPNEPQPNPNPNEPQPNPNPDQPNPNPNANEPQPTPNPGNTEQGNTGTSPDTQSTPQENTTEQSNIISKIYNVPVKLMHAYENRPSMGNPALVKTARVICQSNGKTQVILTINGLEFMNMYGHVWNLFHYVGGNPEAAQVLKWHNDKNLVGKLQKFPYQFSLLRSGKESRIKVRVWVDAMDALKNGAKTYDKIQPGSGAQDAYLVLDWSNATLIEETHGAQIAGGKGSANPESLRQEGILANASNPDDANAQASDQSLEQSESLETGASNVSVDGGNSASQESSQADTSDASYITIAAAVLICGVGIVGLMYYFKNRKKA